MRNRSGTILLSLLGIVVVTCLSASIAQSTQAHAAANRQVARFAALRRTAEEISTLRAAQPPSADDATIGKGDKLASATAEILATAGLPASTLSSLSPESETNERADAQVSLRRRRATLTLTPLTLPQLGRFLDAWRQRLPSWTIARIDLDPRRDINPAPGSDLPIRVVISVENIRLASDRRNP